MVASLCLFLSHREMEGELVFQVALEPTATEQGENRRRNAPMSGLYVVFMTLVIARRPAPMRWPLVPVPVGLPRSGV